MVMTVKVEREDPNDPTSELWLTVLSDGKPELGAHIPANARRDDHDPSLTVFWCGDTSRSRFRNAVERTEKLFLARGGYVGTLFAFGGQTEEEIGPIKHEAQANSSDAGLGEYLSETNPLGWFSAYRAEFEGNEGQVKLWANVADAEVRRLDEGGENIGVCTSPALFYGAARSLIADTIEDTRKLSRKVVEGLLGEIAENVPIAPSAAR